MFRFFRNIRQQLLNENKTLRYLKYAVGEFLLIVAGILAALQIQTWNEGRKLEQDRLELIENLKVDFRTSIKRLDETLLSAQSRLDNSRKFLLFAAGEENDLSIEEAKSLAQSAYLVLKFRPALSSYESAKSNGSIALIKDSKLIEAFLDFDKFYQALQGIDEIYRFDNFVNSGFELRKETGSLSVYYPVPWADTPNIFDLSDQEYREVIAKKKVYAAFENKQNLRTAYRDFLVGMRSQAEQILTALETLD